MKAIGTIVVLLLIGIGVTMYVVTRPPDRKLDPAGRAWIDRFEAWHERTSRDVEVAYVRMNFRSERRNARLIGPLRNCSTSLGRVGLPPEFLEPVLATAQSACGEAEYAVAVNDEFGTASLATVKLHLGEAGERLRVSGRSLRLEMREAA